MFNFTGRALFYAIAITLFITYFLYLQSVFQSVIQSIKIIEIEKLNTSFQAQPRPAETNRQKVHNKNSPRIPLSKKGTATPTSTYLQLDIDRIELNRLMSNDIKNLILRETNPKIYNIIDVPYQQHHFTDFGQMAEELRLLQTFWLANRQLVEKAVINGKNVLHSQVRQYLLNLTLNDKTLSQYFSKLEDFYYLMGRLEQKLVGWIQPYHADLATLYDSYQPGTKAIVIPIGNGYMSSGTTVIHAIRKIHKCDIPIHVYYIGESDLNKDNGKILQNLAENVYIHDITKLLDNRIIDLGGWALKPFAALLAPAEEVMLIDADITFIQSPEVFFEHPGYKQDNSLFFYDRAMWKNDIRNAKWTLDFIMNNQEFEKLHHGFKYKNPETEIQKVEEFPIPRRLQNSRWLTLKAAHEQESGVVLINKRERFIPLLATCSMNNKQERDDVTYRFVHGDKETFWMGFEMLGGQYAWNPNLPGMISDATIEPTNNGGEMPDLTKSSQSYKWQGTNKLCSTQILHFDHDKEPYWFNGGLYANRLFKEYGLGNFTHYLHATEAEWSLGFANWVCMTSNDGEVEEFPKKYKQIIKATEDIFSKSKIKFGFEKFNSHKSVSKPMIHELK